jgi:ribosome maturation factor RimP
MRELIEQIVNNVLSGKGIELVEMDLRPHGKKPVVRIFVDRPGGITVNECAEVSRELSVNFFVEESIPDNLVIEVSSPGLDRPLKTRRDFERAVEKELDAAWRCGDGIVEKTVKLLGVTEAAARFLTPEGEKEVQLADIIRAKQHIRF